MFFSNWSRSARRRRAERALARQLDYQKARASESAESHEDVMAAMAAHSRSVRERLEEFAPIADDARVLEVGSGSEGLIFFFGCSNGVGIDPLAEEYAATLPWHKRVTTLSGHGENLPFEDAAFDIVLCDNVIDHAEDPAQIVREIVRVLKPGGLLYFTVNVHHLFWHVAATIHASARAVGLPFEVAPFADHTVHLTLARARKLIEAQPLRVLNASDNIEAVKRGRWREPTRHVGDMAKRIFFKNATFVVVARREAGG